MRRRTKISDRARKRLEAEKSNELEQLLKEGEREFAQEALDIAQGSVNHANTLLKQLDSLLKWIAGQLAEIATVYASSWGANTTAIY